MSEKIKKQSLNIKTAIINVTEIVKNRLHWL